MFQNKIGSKGHDINIGHCLIRKKTSYKQKNHCVQHPSQYKAGDMEMSNVVCLQQAHSWVETDKEIIDYLLCDKIYQQFIAWLWNIEEG